MRGPLREALRAKFAVPIKPAPPIGETWTPVTDMKEVNGLHVYFKGEQPPTPEGAPALPQVVSLFGFKLVELDGESIWMAASRQDYIDSESRRLGGKRDEAENMATHKESAVDSCRSLGFGCIGKCTRWSCTYVYSPFTRHTYCTCVPFE
jgi:hypothetical protein